MQVSDFEGRLGTVYTVDMDGRTVSLKLAEVQAMSSGMREGGAFSAVFEGPDGTDLPQAIHRLVAGDDALELFLVPIGPFGEGMGFEAVFT